MTLQFRPEEFERFRAALVKPLRSGATSAVQQAASTRHVQLPRYLSGAQQQIDEILARVPESIAQLQAMTETFDRKLAETAEEYRRSDEVAAARLRAMMGDPS